MASVVMPATGAPVARFNPAPWLLSAPALLLFFGLLFVPLALTAVLSFSVYDSVRGVGEGHTLANYIAVLTDDYYHEIFTRTLLMSLAVTLLSVLLGVPEAIILSRMRSPWRAVFLMVILAPLLISVVVRTLGWAILLGNEGLINTGLLRLGLIETPLRLLYTMTGVTIALTHVLIPFMIISIWASLQKLDVWVESAGLSLGASRATVVRRVILPQIMPGILSGGIIVFALAASAFATPAILGGRRLKVVATAAYDEFTGTLNWPLGAAIAVLLLIGMLAVILGSNWIIERRYAQIFET